MVLDGKGDQQFLTESYAKDRRKALKDRTKFKAADLENLGITELQGQGMTNADSYTVEQYPYPMDPTIRKKKDVDIRKVDPTIGEMND